MSDTNMTTHYDPDTGKPVPAPVKADAKSARKLPAPKEPTKDERVASLLANYAFGLEHNSPRTPAELAELRFLFGKEVKPVPITPAERVVLMQTSAPRVVKDTFLMEKADRVPVNTIIAPVPVEVVTAHPDLVGLSYFVVDDKLVLVDGNRVIVGVV